MPFSSYEVIDAVSTVVAAEWYTNFSVLWTADTRVTITQNFHYEGWPTGNRHLDHSHCSNDDSCLGNGRSSKRVMDTPCTQIFI